MPRSDRLSYVTLRGYLIGIILLGVVSPVLAQDSMYEDPGIFKSSPADSRETNKSPDDDQTKPNRNPPEPQPVQAPRPPPAQQSINKKDYSNKADGEKAVPKYYEKEDLKAQRRMADGTDELVYWSRQQLYLSIFGVLLLIPTLFYTGRAAFAASKAANVAEAALTGLEKPYVIVNAVKFDEPLTRETFNYDTEQRHPWVHYTIKNYGRSPAIINEFCGQVWIGADLPSAPKYRESDIYRQEDTHVLGREEKLTYQALTRIQIDGSIMNDLGIGTQRIYFFGYVKCKSLFGHVETVGFCWQYNLNLGLFMQEDMPNYTYRKQGKA